MTSAVQQPGCSTYQKRVELTAEEAHAWHTCMKSSSVLAPTVLSAAIGYGVCRMTPLRAKAKYAAAISGVIGLISGRITISALCLEKVASLPNSTLRERLTEAGYYGNKRMSERFYQGLQPLDIISDTQTLQEPSTELKFDDYQSMTTFDTYSSFNDSHDHHASEDTDLTEPINLQKGISYDELRDKNREEFHKKNKQMYIPSREERYPTRNERDQQQIPTTSASQEQKKNQYGDMWG